MDKKLKRGDFLRKITCPYCQRKMDLFIKTLMDKKGMIHEIKNDIDCIMTDEKFLDEHPEIWEED